MEVRYAPMLHTRNGLRLAAVVEAVLAGLRQAQADRGIESNVILCGIRNISPASSLAIVQLDTDYKVAACNPAFEKLFLYTEDEARGRNLDEDRHEQPLRSEVPDRR